MGLFLGRRHPLVASAAGTTLYVDDEAAGCNDTGPGSAAEPFCQIQPAADAAVPGDTVRIAGNGTSYAPVTIESTGTADAPVTFLSAYGDGTLPTVSNDDLTAGQTRPVLAVVPIGADG
ncbi:hypothetical protein [Streptomyces canus]|uniref:hypothetical protein n=1 Tax=Streptomyces canus TaxID=58343 RepID=UPI0037FC723D